MKINKAVFIDATKTLSDQVRATLNKPDRAHQLGVSGITFAINCQPDLNVEEIPHVVDEAELIWVDHTQLPNEIAQRCSRLKHVVFMGTGARSYMDIEGLAALGIEVHLIKNYGDTAVAECAFGLMWASAKRFGEMDRGIRQGLWLRTEGVQLTGKTVGLIGFGGIGAEMARLCLGAGLNVVAWNRSPRTCPGVEFLPLEQVLAQSDVISLHLLLEQATQEFMSDARLKQMKPGVILINTARGGLIDEKALVCHLKSGHISYAGLDVYNQEPLPFNHPLTQLENVMLLAHSAFRVPEATERLVDLALNVTERIFSLNNK